MENWVLLRVLMIFATVAKLLAAVGITGVRAWLAARRSAHAIPVANRAPRDFRGSICERILRNRLRVIGTPDNASRAPAVSPATG
jgi:hypothetical protein